MKIHNWLAGWWLVVVMAMSLGASGSAHGNWFGGGTKVDSNEQLAKLFGMDRAFTATAVISVRGRGGKETHSAEMKFAMLDGKLRTELDMTKTKSAQQRAAGVEQMAAMGMNEMVTLLRPDQKLTYIIYPGLKAYCALPVADESVGSATPPTIEKKELGREPVDGRPCVKSLVTLTDAKGKQTEMTIWEATDLDNFVVQSEVGDGKDTVRTTFTDIKLGKPAAALFEPPTDFKRYPDMQSMMMGAMQQMMEQ